MAVLSPVCAGALRRHGGRLAEAGRLWPEAPQPWIDLSTGISPYRYPAPRATLQARARLPDPERLEALERRAAAAFGVADPRRVVALSGAESAIALLPTLLGADSVALDAPTYGGHADAWRAAGAAILSWSDAGVASRLAVVTNPNNPDGRRRRPETLLALADRLQATGGWLIVDESFVEVAPELSVASVAHPATIVLRSFGKIYGLAGLRLGFLLAEPALAERARARLGDWPVSADALAAGLAAYGDASWLARHRRRLARDAAWLDRRLLAHGFEVVGGTTLFRLTRSRDAQARFVRLGAQGVLARPFEDPDLLRFGLPSPAERARVTRALAACA